MIDRTQYKILLTGKNGQVGYELERSLASLGTVHGFDRTGLDLSMNDEIHQRVMEIRPDIIVNAAAYTAVDRAEAEPEIANQINGVAPGVMAEAAKKIGALMVHYSTDYVFDGRKNRPYTEEDSPNPLGVYGKSKLAGELAIRAVGGEYLIFRTSWVYGARGRNFLLAILGLAQSISELRVVDDQFGSPTSSRTIATVTTAVLQQTLANRGHYKDIFHLTAQGVTTWCRFAQAALQQSGSSTRTIPITAAEYGAAAPRPANSALCTEKLSKAFNITLPAWDGAMGEVLRDIQDQRSQ